MIVVWSRWTYCRGVVPQEDMQLQEQRALNEKSAEILRERDALDQFNDELTRTRLMTVAVCAQLADVKRRIAKKEALARDFELSRTVVALPPSDEM